MKAGWQIKTLAEVCQIKPPKAEARHQVTETKLVSFAPMEDLGINEKFLVPTRTRTLAEVAGSYTYFANGDVLLAKITPCFENGKLGIAENLTNGRVSKEFIETYPIPLPPLIKQHRIVAALDELKKSLLHQAFSGQL